MEAIHAKPHNTAVIVAVGLFLGAVVAANLLVVQFGPSITIVNAFVLIAFDLVTRDVLHDRWRGDGLVWKMGLLIAVGGSISYAMNRDAGIIALASMLAFSSASAADGLVYHSLLRLRWWKRANVSNVAGAAVDSLLFPTIAFGVLMPEIVAGQFLAKILGGFIWTIVLRRWMK